jgi:hypothetical protein
MTVQPPKTAPRRFRRILIALAFLIVVAAPVGGWAYLNFMRHDRAGLEGTWRWASETSRTTYEFLPSGELASWNGPKNWWSRIGWSASWRRNGSRITIRTDGNWNFDGELEGDKIRGKMLMRDEKGATVTTGEMVLQKYSQLPGKLGGAS